MITEYIGINLNKHIRVSCQILMKTCLMIFFLNMHCEFELDSDQMTTLAQNDKLHVMSDPFYII